MPSTTFLKTRLLTLLLLSSSCHINQAFSSIPLANNKKTTFLSLSSSPTTETKIPPLPSSTTHQNSTNLIELTHSFVYSGNGFYSPIDPSQFSEEFVFRGPYIGPLNKVDYINTMNTFKLYEAIPDLSPNAFGYTIDPQNPNRVWFMVRNSGTFTGTPGIGLGNGMFFPPNGKSIEGCTETFSITFEEDTRQVKLLTVGYPADRFQGNTEGKGAAVGIFNAVGLPFPGPGTLYSLITWFQNKVVKGSAKTVSDAEDIPKWWTNKDRGMEGYS